MRLKRKPLPPLVSREFPPLVRTGTRPPIASPGDELSSVGPSPDAERVETVDFASWPEAHGLTRAPARAPRPTLGQRLGSGYVDGVTGPSARGLNAVRRWRVWVSSRDVW